MRAVILCGYRGLDEGEEALGLQRNASGKTLLEVQIETLTAMRFDVTCVLSGNMADEQLRACRRLGEVEMVFDDAKNPSLLSNAREGAKSEHLEACFMLPVEIPAPPREVWDFLRGVYNKGGHDTMESAFQTGASGFPLLFTRRGVEQLQKIADLKSLLDPRLAYLPVAPEHSLL